MLKEKRENDSTFRLLPVSRFSSGCCPNFSDVLFLLLYLQSVFLCLLQHSPFELNKESCVRGFRLRMKLSASHFVFTSVTFAHFAVLYLSVSFLSPYLSNLWRLQESGERIEAVVTKSMHHHALRPMTSCLDLLSTDANLHD